MKTTHPLIRRRTAVAIALTLVTGPLIISSLKAGDGESDTEEARIRRGFQIAPVPLNMAGKHKDLVGLGSYLVNAQMGCNDCHSAGPATQFLPGGNAFFGQHPAKTNPATYMGGGRDFGSLIPNTPSIVSRNLTPDKTGLPIGGDDFAKFLHIMRTGTDPDHVHPPCSASLTSSCLPPPFDGDLLQIMPWPAYQQMTKKDLAAIYEYLSAIPCVEGGPGEPENRCH